MFHIRQGKKLNMSCYKGKISNNQQRKTVKVLKTTSFILPFVGRLGDERSYVCRRVCIAGRGV